MNSSPRERQERRFRKASFPTIYCACEGGEINTKSRGCGWRLRLGVYGGADRRKTSFPPCRLHHPHRHAVHDAIRHDGKKIGLRPFKKSGFRRYKNNWLLETPPQTLLKAPPHPSPSGGSSTLQSLRLFGQRFFPLGKTGMGLPCCDGASVLDGTHPRQLCRSCDFIAQG